MNCLPGATARLGANLAPFEVYPLISRGCVRIPILVRSINAPCQRSDTLMQLLRSTAQRSTLRRMVPDIQVGPTRKAFGSASKPPAISGIRDALYYQPGPSIHVGPWTPSGLVASDTACAWSIAPLMVTCRANHNLGTKRFKARRFILASVYVRVWLGYPG
jgi:hypothetical protein